LLDQLDDNLKEAKGKLWINVRGSSRWKIGKQFRIEVQSQVGGRLILVDIGGAAVIRQAFPNKYSGAHHTVEAGVLMKVPDTGYGFDFFTAEGPPGPGRIIAIVVPSAFPYETLVGSQEILSPGEIVNDRGTISREESLAYLVNLVDQVTRTIRETRSASVSGEITGWGYAVLEYEVVE
jgi:hypothetical protein